MADLLLEQRDGLLAVTFNRPQKANSLTVDMLHALTRVLHEARNTAAVRGVLITGAGERVFSGGVDVRYAPALPEAELRQYRQSRSTAFFAVLMQLAEFEKPVVAAVNGVASGGGFMIAALADAIIAAENAFFALPEIDLGSPPLAGMAILAPLTGSALAYDLVQSARNLSATEAVQRGIARRVVPREEVAATAEKLARDLMAKPARAFAANKAWMRQPQREALERAERAMVAWRAAGGEA